MEFLNETEYTKVCSYIMNKIDKGPGYEVVNDKLEELAAKLEKYIFEKVMDDKYEMHYQPIFGVDNVTKGAEALFRMKNPLGATNPKLKNINPEVAFYLLKQSGHENAVVYNQMSKICSDMNKNKIFKIDPNYKISINIPLNCLDENFIQYLARELTKNHLTFSNLQIEILETEDFSNIRKHHDIIRKLKWYGVAFALDDFGTRNAKDLVALDFLQYDVIKIAKELLDEAKQTGDFTKLKKVYNKITEIYPYSIIIMEGVEGSKHATESNYISTKQVVDNLKEIGPILFQGYGFAEPQSASDLHDTIIRSHTQNPPSSMGE